MRAKASICITGDSLVPRHVTRLVGVEPTYSRAKGQRIEATGKKYSNHPTGVWVLDCPLNGKGELPQQLEWCIATLRSMRASPDSALDKLEFALWLGVFGDSGNIELELSPAIMRELADLNATVRYDIYHPGNSVG